MKYIILLITVSLLVSCSQYTCPTNNGGKEPRDKTKRMTAEVILKEGSISKDHVKTMLISVHRTMMGFKHSFLTDTKDTIVINLNYRFEINKCYWVHKNYLKKTS